MMFSPNFCDVLRSSKAFPSHTNRRQRVCTRNKRPRTPTRGARTNLRMGIWANLVAPSKKIDTGASVSLTPNKSDSISKVQPFPLKTLNGLVGESQVQGSGTVKWTWKDLYGIFPTIRTTAYLAPGAQIQLFPPECYFKGHQGGFLTTDHRNCVLTLANKSELEFPFQPNNILMMMDAADVHVSKTSIIYVKLIWQCWLSQKCSICWRY